MTTPESAPTGRRERNKKQKLDRITAAADELFARFGVDDVTTQQIAEAADVGTGTLFLYARSKGELLLLVQNSHYAEAVTEGTEAAATMTSPLDAVMALVKPVVECNRRQTDNGRTYLRELIFGDPEETHHAIGLEIIQRVETEYVRILQREGRFSAEHAGILARIISATMFVSLASPEHVSSSIDQICDDIRDQVRLLLRE